jgi:hypothetical protein
MIARELNRGGKPSSYQATPLTQVSPGGTLTKEGHAPAGMNLQSHLRGLAAYGGSRRDNTHASASPLLFSFVGAPVRRRWRPGSLSRDGVLHALLDLEPEGIGDFLEPL